MIIELFVEAMRGERSDSSVKLDQLRWQEKAVPDRTFLSPVQRKQLARVRKEIGELEQKQPYKFYDDARRQMMMLPLMRGVRAVSMAYTCLGPSEVPCREGFRIPSAYALSTGVKIWLITESDRSASTFLLPSGY